MVEISFFGAKNQDFVCLPVNQFNGGTQWRYLANSESWSLRIFVLGHRNKQKKIKELKQLINALSFDGLIN